MGRHPWRGCCTTNSGANVGRRVGGYPRRWHPTTNATSINRDVARRSAHPADSTGTVLTPPPQLVLPAPWTPPGPPPQTPPEAFLHSGSSMYVYLLDMLGLCDLPLCLAMHQLAFQQYIQNYSWTSHLNNNRIQPLHDHPFQPNAISCPLPCLTTKWRECPNAVFCVATWHQFWQSSAKLENMQNIVFFFWGLIYIYIYTHTTSYLHTIHYMFIHSTVHLSKNSVRQGERVDSEVVLADRRRWEPWGWRSLGVSCEQFSKPLGGWWF